jgi:hypothetical protein
MKIKIILRWCHINNWIINVSSYLIISFVLLFSANVYAEYDLPNSRKPYATNLQWQNVGTSNSIPSGGNEVNCVTLYNVPTDGTSNSVSNIQNCLNSISNGEVAYLPAGTYKINGIIKVPSNKVLRGAGMGITTISVNHSGGDTLNFWSGQVINACCDGSAVNITGGLTKGSTQIDTSGSHGLNVGDMILIDQLEDAAADPPIYHGGCNWCGRASGTRPIGQVNKVSVVIDANTVLLETPLYMTYDINRIPQLVQNGTWVKNAGVESLTISNDGGGGANWILNFFNAENSWVYNVEFLKIRDGFIRFYAGYRNTVKKSKFHGMYNAVGFDEQYGIYLNPAASGNLIEDNIFYDTQLAIVMNGATSGNVIAYNYVHSMKSISTYEPVVFSVHGAHPMMNLFEGNRIDGLFGADIAWGTSSHNTVFRNYITPSLSNYPNQDHVIVLQTGQTYYSVLGNVLGTNGFENIYEAHPSDDCYSDGFDIIFRLGCSYPKDTTIRSTLLRHRNFDYLTDTTKNCDGAGEPGCQGGSADVNLPASFYLSGKPAFFECRSWPSIGSDLNPMFGSLPAVDRFDGVNPCGIVPKPPTNLREL